MTGHAQTDLDLLVAVARGVIDLSAVDRPSAFRLPYPPELQLALDRMVLAGLAQGLPMPAGVPELLSWCREREPPQWPLALPDGLLTFGARLIHPTAGEPTRTCAELTSLGPHSVLEEAETLLSGLFAASGTVERFTACRDFLIRRAVILRFDPVEVRPTMAPTWRLVRQLYGPVPDRFAVDGLLHRCTGCGLLAKPTVNGPWCEGGCLQAERKLESHQPGQALALPLALRLFLALPGRTELPVRARLAEQPRLLLPALGVYRLTDQNGTLRAFQVHDREQPRLAAQQAVEVATLLDEPLDVVVPDDLAARPGYRQGFDDTLATEARVRLLSASEFTAPQPSDRVRRNDA
ncbi:hypothetical protein ACQPZZ_37570 [Microbispora sp. CA-135349]|uniref:pPIWI_RE_Y domain-containing protein n=1 Tax=Microbispora sp. CA-135349 TaxID=3239953 RepID=UPI003D907716